MLPHVENDYSTVDPGFHILPAAACKKKSKNQWLELDVAFDMNPATSNKSESIQCHPSRRNSQGWIMSEFGSEVK
jgi:hypothetical protein